MLRSRIMGAAAIVVSLCGPARAQFPDLFALTMSEGDKLRYTEPSRRALADCVAKVALADPAGAMAYKLGNFDAYVVGAIDQCPGDANRLIAAYDRVYGQGQGASLLRGPYSDALPRAVIKRDKDQLMLKVEELKREEVRQAAKNAQARADAEVRARQEAAEQASRAAEAERRVALAKAEAERAKAEERAAVQAAEAERQKQIATATGAAKLLAERILICGRGQLRSLVKSGEPSETLASAVMTICKSDVEHFVDAGIAEYKLEDKLSSDSAETFAREKLRAETRERIVAIAVQAKAGVGDFAASSN